MIYFKHLLLSHIVSKQQFFLCSWQLLPPAFAFCPAQKAESKGEEWKTCPNSTCHHCNTSSVSIHRQIDRGETEAQIRTQSVT